MQRQNYQPEGLAKRIVNGKNLYYHAVAVEGVKRMIFVSGQLSRSPQEPVVGKGDMAAQIRQVGENVTIALEAAGATLENVIKTNTYVTDIDEFFKHVDLRMQYFLAMPTSTTVEVRRLSHPDYMVEIEVVAMV